MRVLAQSMYVNQHLAASKRQKRGCYFFLRVPREIIFICIVLTLSVTWSVSITGKNPSNPPPALHLHDFQVARFKVLQVFQVLLCARGGNRCFSFVQVGSTLI